MDKINRILEDWVDLEIVAQKENKEFPPNQEAAKERITKRRQFKKELLELGLSNLAVEIFQQGVKVKGAN